MIVVTGATGHVGTALLAQLTQPTGAHHQPIRAIRHVEPLPQPLPGVEVADADVRDLDALRRVFKDAHTVYHLAARVEVQGTYADLHATNTQGTYNALRASLDAGVRRFVHVSSIHALDSCPSDAPIDETNALALHDSHMPYDRSKAEAELLVQKATKEGLHAVIVNPTGVIGPHDHRPSPMGRVVRMLAQRQLPAVVNAAYNFVDVRDVTAGIVAAAARGRPGERYLLGGHWVPFPDLAAMVAAASGVKTVPTVPMWLARAGVPLAGLASRLRGQEPLWTRNALRIVAQNAHVCSAKSQRELAHTARPLQHTIADTVAWFAQQEAAKDPPQKGHGRRHQHQSRDTRHRPILTADAVRRPAPSPELSSSAPRGGDS